MAITDEDMRALELQMGEAQKTQQLAQTSQLLDNQSPSIDNVGMFAEQTNLEPVYDLIDHLLEGQTLERDPTTGQRKWTAPTDEDMILLSKQGINFVRKRMSWHVNINTLMSNYTEDEVNEIVKTFSLSLQEALFLKANEFFNKPTLEKCYSILKQRVEQRVQLKIYAREMLGLTSDKIKITKEILEAMESKLEEELENIRRQLIESRRKEFESLIIDLEFLVWSTYNRALRGEERASHRRHQQALEIKGGGSLGGENSIAKPGLISSMFKK